MKMKIRFIVNPFSGGRDKSALESWIKQRLDHRRFDYDYCVTAQAGEGATLASEAVDLGYDVVVAVGGDGSVNEVGQRLVGTETALGILPYGSGNGFAMHLGLGRDPKKAIDYINRGQPSVIDSCSVNGRFYVNVAGVGFEAYVAYKTKLLKKRGLQVYAIGAMRESMAYKNKHYRVTVEGRETQLVKALSITVANASMFGYNFSIAPMAYLNDGVLDVVTIADAPKWRYVANLWRFFNRSIEKSPITSFERATTVEIESDDVMYYHLDGEGMKTNEALRFAIRPNSLRIWIPEDIQ